MTEPELVSERLAALHERLLELGGPDVRVVAVTKRVSVDAMVAAVEAGHLRLGESYAQELMSKWDQPDLAGAEWHLIGQLQTNKVRLVAGRIALYQGVDRPKLVAELAKRDPGAEVLVQVDLAGIDGRGGCAWSEVDDLVESASSAGLVPVGLMGVAPGRDRDEDRRSFERLVSVRDRLGLAVASIGMSGDWESAVAAGGNMVRIGSAIFGARPVD